jgi:hypothetical protein
MIRGFGSLNQLIATNFKANLSEKWLQFSKTIKKFMVYQSMRVQIKASELGL